MTRLLVDSSVLVKWFHAAGEADLAPARAVRVAHAAGVVQAHVLDLAVYEIGNVLARSLRWSATRVADRLDDLLAVVGPPLALSDEARRLAAELGERYGLTFYDAAWAATATVLGIALVSADRRLLVAGMAESPAATAQRLRLA